MAAGFIAEIIRHATAIAESIPLSENWRATAAIPNQKIVRHLRRALWPNDMETIAQNQTGVWGAEGGVVRDCPRTVSIVPEAWLRELAKRMNLPFADMCRGILKPI